jgi:BirA family transcriptional regulator, biotin operon repressor / biotin---[acetyl-CoA-carboxylase] ligase
MLTFDEFTLLKKLADGAYYSQSALTRHFSVTRTQINTHISSLKQAGIVIVQDTQGYQIPAGLELLCSERILAHLPTKLSKLMPTPMIFNEVGSTNEVLLTASHKQDLMTCLAERQTQGRGRFGRTWISPLAANIYASLLWQSPCSIALGASLSIAVGVAIAELLRELFGEQVQLKWPNDVVVGKKKLAGILIETQSRSDHVRNFVIGIGLNVHMPSQYCHSCYVDLYQLTGKRQSRNKLVAAMLARLVDALALFKSQGLAPFVPAWRRLDVLAEQAVHLRVAGEDHFGVAEGVDERGNLVLMTKAGKRHFHSGVATVIQADTTPY